MHISSKSQVPMLKLDDSSASVANCRHASQVYVFIWGHVNLVVDNVHINDKVLLWSNISISTRVYKLFDCGYVI